MHYMIRAYDNANQPLADTTTDAMQDVYFNPLRPAKNEPLTIDAKGFELLAVVLSGRCNIMVGDQHFNDVGQRADIWSGRAAHTSTNGIDTECP
ncbi:5-deoxy-glucuronate isomerase [Roseicitreum antarcticum]|uniref:KduI/IolB family protein n=1 Tax=Roseicitreum antarcticum TaxID=564137 RepID=A0A1H3AUG2_9RHOB|nr:5-deoxy-glucuronate isomerase [Roseicitreum antarcticum]SDX33021.1 KduI/IolB family protein [Roseicitreum antarcticum]